MHYALFAQAERCGMCGHPWISLAKIPRKHGLPVARQHRARRGKYPGSPEDILWCGESKHSVFYHSSLDALLQA